MKRSFVALIGAFIAFAASAWAQINLVQVTPCGPGAFPATTCSIPPTQTGDLILVGWASDLGVNPLPTISSVTDSAGNTYAQAGSSRAINTSGNRMVDLWYAKNSTPGATTLTITTNPAGANGAAVIWEFSGVDTTAPLTHTSTLNTQPATTTPAGASITTATAGELIVSTMIPSTWNYGLAAGSSFTSDQSQAGVGWVHLVAASPGTYAAQWSTDSGTYASSSVSFKATGSGTGTGGTGTGGTGSNACDLASPFGTIDSADVNAAISMSLGLTPCTANIAGNGVCNVAVVQRVVNAMPPPSGTSTCVTGFGAVPHSVALNWTASTTPNVTYNVYRSTASGAYGSALASVPAGTTSYTDTTAQAGLTYFYVIRAVDPSNSSNVSSPSNEVQAIIPTP